VEPLAIQDREAECTTAVTPVPESVTLAGEFVALLVTVTLPVTLPVAAGANVTVNVAVCPADKISPAGTPLAVKPAPDMLTFETVTLDVPALLKAMLWLPLLDTFTLPKLKLEALAFRTSVVAVTVSVAELLVAVPKLLPTLTVNFALLSVVVSAGVV
jgi:hypothetical protein